MHRYLPRSRKALLLFLLVLPSLAPADAIDRIDPPYWWTGFADSQLQLLVYGDDIAGLDVEVNYPGVTLERVLPGDSPKYLFVYLAIAPSAPPGTLALRFRDGDRVQNVDFRLEARERDPARLETFSARDAIYLITPDRFANGDPGNDTVAGYEDGVARDEAYGRHGGDLAGIGQHLDYIAGLGFTQLWLNPVLENAMPEASYHGYATTDYYRVDPRFGSNADYRALADAAREQGLGLIMDMIVNHIGSKHPWLADLPRNDWVHAPGDIRITSHARTTQQDPYASDYDRAAFADGWFVDSMPDLNQQDPLLADYLVQNALWWIEYLGLAGIRQDTWPYADKAFLADWARRIRAEYPGFNIVGEEWSPNPVVVSYWQAGKVQHDGYESWLPSLMDFPLQMALAQSLTQPEPKWGSAWTPVYEMLGNDYLYPDPFNLVIFPDNHDMSRIATQLGDDPARVRMALVFYCTMRGIPQLYYGTEVLMSHPGSESHGLIRSDFPGGWDGDEVNAFTGRGLAADARDMQSFLRQLLAWRQQASVVHSGKLMQFTPEGNVWVYFRYDETDDESVDDADTVMVAFNRGEDTVQLDLARFAERIGNRRTGKDIMTGRSYELDKPLPLAAESALILELNP